MLRPWHHTFTLDKNADLSIHQQLKQHFQQMIAQGTWLAGSALPSTREIAQQLGINRKTVARVYDELLAHGLIYTQPKRGTFVAEIPHTQLAETLETLAPIIAEHLPYHELQQMIQKTVLQHTRRAALHLHKLQTHDYDSGGLRSLRQMLASQLAHEKKLLVSPQSIVCSTWLALEHSLFDTLKQRSGLILTDDKQHHVRMQQQGLETLCLPEAVHSSHTSTLIEQIEKYCINYPVTTVWLSAASLLHTQQYQLQSALAQRIQNYQLLMIEDCRKIYPAATKMQLIAAQIPQQAIVIANLYGIYCDMFNLHYLTVPDAFLSVLRASMDSQHQQSLLLTMLAHSSLLQRGDYKKLMQRIQDSQHIHDNETG